MKILVTGCAGFIGFHFSRLCLSKNISVIGVDNINDYYDPSLKNSRLQILKEYKKFKFIKADISDTNFLEYFPQSIYTKIIIVHLAAQAGVRFSIDSPNSYTKSNLVGFANILELSRRLNSRLVYASTSSVYGLNTNLPFSEKHIADHPIQYYAATKRSNEIMAHSYSHMYELEMIGLRFFTVYGPWGRPDMALFKFTKNILEDKPIDVFNNGNHIRDFTYIDDITMGIFLAINYEFKNEPFDTADPLPNNGISKFKIYNLGNNSPISLMDYINKIEQELDKSAKVNFYPLQQGDVIETRSDITQAIKELGYNPVHNVDYGIKQFVSWYKEYYGK